MAKLVFVFASMNTGKSLSLLTKNFMLKQKGFTTLLMKPEIDDRTATISSRLGIEEECVIIPKESSIKLETPIDYVLIDEAQFLTKSQVWDLALLVDNQDVNVICYGLKLNWQGDFFEASSELMKIADELIQMETYCKDNPEAASMFHIKLKGSNSGIETGYEDMYKSVSRKEWSEWWNSSDISSFF